MSIVNSTMMDRVGMPNCVLELQGLHEFVRHSYVSYLEICHKFCLSDDDAMKKNEYF